MSIAKQLVIDTLDSLPDDCSLKEIQHRLDTIDLEKKIQPLSAITLTQRDWDVFMKSLDDTDTLRPKLALAMRRYREWQKT